MYGISPPTLVRSHEIRPLPALFQQTNRSILGPGCPAGQVSDSFTGVGNKGCTPELAPNTFSLLPRPNTLGYCIINVYETLICENEDEPADVFAEGDTCGDAETRPWRAYTITNCDDGDD